MEIIDIQGKFFLLKICKCLEPWVCKLFLLPAGDIGTDCCYSLLGMLSRYGYCYLGWDAVWCGD